MNIEERTKKVIAEMLGVSVQDLKPETHMNDDLGADSLDDVELVMALEDEFELEIPDAHAESCRTVAQIVEYVVAHAKK